jgi:hypothetical protein
VALLPGLGALCFQQTTKDAQAKFNKLRENSEPSPRTFVWYCRTTIYHLSCSKMTQSQQVNIRFASIVDLMNPAIPTDYYSKTVLKSPFKGHFIRVNHKNMEKVVKKTLLLQRKSLTWNLWLKADQVQQLFTNIEV